MSEFYGDSPSPPDIIVNIKDNISIEDLFSLEEQYNQSKNKCFITFLKNNISRIKAEKYLQILKNTTCNNDCKFKYYYKCLVEAYA